MAADPLAALLALRDTTPRRIVGLMSGTSADGIDAALVEIAGAGAATRARLLGFAASAYAPDLRGRILGAGEATAAEVTDLHYRLGEEFARAALMVIEPARRAGLAVHLVGSHGQTARHHPRAGTADGRGATLQLAEPAVIAERTGLPVVADFRPRDVAAGGEGAPLVPLVDWLLFRAPGRRRACLNLGGIANITVLADRLEDVRAFDVGPANMPLDAVVSAWSGGIERFDRDGARAAGGRVEPRLLEELLAHPFLALPPPKSTGREAFGAAFVRPLLARFVGREADLLATLTRFVAEAVAGALRRFVPASADEVLVSGGGARNRALMAALRETLAPAAVRSLEEVGMDPDAKEAVAFAVLANETLFGHPGNLPGVTGAAGPRVLGKIVLA
ncbi:MAG TPA: anhydro-N-acetylmuramic acid kinase [Methylomirabilota bacterium]|nr:anhydro-N-acetylmuramic acid kinase [Methylomirabilota bacterium]